jgi:hypothetical protein
MQKRSLWWLFSLIFCLAVATASPSQAQMAAPSKPPIYLYTSSWAVPRAQWGEMAKIDNLDKPLLDKFIADGTLVGYGAYTNLIHQEGEPTHGTWFTATSEGNLLKVLEAFYAHPGSTDAPVEGASKHWDQILTSEVYNSKPGSSTGGYLTWSTWVVKPGEMHAYTELTKKVLVPVLEKLLAEGSITAYGELTEDYHQGKMGTVYDYFTAPDAASLDKANKAFDDAFTSNAALGNAYRDLTEREGHRDFLTRLRFMTNK